jgi:hypothetical protein
VGAVFAEIPGYLKLKQEWEKDRDHPPEWPAYFRSKKYWGITVLLVLAGGGWVDIWSSEHVITPLLAINLGATAPLAIESISRPTLKVPEFKTD